MNYTNGVLACITTEDVDNYLADEGISLDSGQLEQVYNAVHEGCSNWIGEEYYSAIECACSNLEFMD